ncbi:hypothetical protein GCM10025877_12740 [Agromyces mangrovi Wang et al. 2018]|nr:hypothetical protein GCM10025877_12740 [Agromyces mangrovi]
MQNDGDFRRHAEPRHPIGRNLRAFARTPGWTGPLGGEYAGRYNVGARSNVCESTEISRDSSLRSILRPESPRFRTHAWAKGV